MAEGWWVPWQIRTSARGDAAEFEAHPEEELVALRCDPARLGVAAPADSGVEHEGVKLALVVAAELMRATPV